MENDAQPGRSPSRDVVEAAARWFVQLQDDSANAHTFAAWNQWLAASSEHRIAYEEIENTVLRLNVVATPTLPSRAEMEEDSYDGSTPVAEFLQRNIRQGSNARRERFRWRLAAVVLVAVGLGSVAPWLLQRGPQPLEATTYQTPPGQRGFIELSDGSRVTLDADSTLSVRMTSERRLLTLSRGEGYFEVAKQRSRPFVVQAGATQVTALGTAFNVRRSDDRTVVAVVEGKVQVVAGMPLGSAERQGAEAHLETNVPAAGTPRLSAHVSAGEAVSYIDDGNLHALPVSEASLATGWLKGHRRYRNESLRYVLADISRYTGRSIVVADEAAGALQFTGTLDLENSGSWLRGLTVALPVTLSQQEDGTLLVTLVKQ